MSKATPMRSHQSSSSGEYRKRLRSYQTPVRRSPRFLPQNDNNVVEITARKQPKPNSTKKRSSNKTHLRSPPITPAPIQISPPKRTQQGCSAKCPNELLRSIENLQGSSNPSQGKPLRRSARLSLIPSLETAKEPVEPVKERRLSPWLMGCAKVPEGKENVHTDGLGDEKGDAKLGTRKAKEKKVREKEKENGERDGLVNLKIEEGVENEKRKKLKICEENVGSEKLDAGECCGSGDWTKEEDAILQRAYLVANPSPHFWKKVARMVPGKSAQDCFDRVNGSFATPPQLQPRSRANRSNLSPVSNFSLSGSKPIQHPIPVVKKLSSRKKNLVAQKTVRHLLRKHCVNDQNREVDHFSVLETSPTALAVELPEASSPISPNCLSSPPGFLQKCSGWSSSAHKKMLSRFKPLAQANQPSPEVLKRIKNMALHEKYIDQLHNRDARRKYVASSSAADRVSKNEGEKKTGVLKAAKAALMSEAKEFISHFQHMRANPQGETNTDDDKEGEEEEEDDE